VDRDLHPTMSAAFIPTIVMSLVMGLGFYTCLSLSPIAILFCHHCKLF